MTRYVEQTQSVAIAKLLSRVGFSHPPWLRFLRLRHLGAPNFVTIALKVNY
ncbi:MAG TPA: hypothetical protein VKR59_05875 [Terriglobales bacterium]|nr:hypothetical protein [Terriglobales bacterium]